MELNEKAETILAAFLAALVDVGNPPASVWPDSLRKTGGDGFRILAGESDSDKDGQAILCIAEDAGPEYPQFTGNFYVPCQVWLRTPVRSQTEAEAAAEEDPQTAPSNTAALADHKAAAAALETAIMLDSFDLRDQLNAAAAAANLPFTCFAILDRKPERQQVENLWASGWSFRLYCCSTNQLP